VFDHINKVDLGRRPFTLEGDSGPYTCDTLVISTGASAKYPGAAQRNSVHGQGRQRLRHLRRLLLPRRRRVRRRRRQHGSGRGAVPVQHRQQGAPGAPPRQVPRRGDHGRQGDVQVESGRIELHLWHTLDEVLGDDSGVTGVRLRHTDGATKDIAVKAASSPSATSPTPTSSRGNWR